MHMPINSEINTLKPFMPFSDDVINFLDDLSKILMKEREFPDIVTFGFWIRRANMMKEKAKYDDANERLGRGVVFHIAPSNVPLNFAFTLAMGLLAGNANIVRLPSRDFEQMDIIVSAINALTSDKYKNLQPYICFVKYRVDKDITDKLSAMCDVRIVWGGDKTIALLRLSPLKPRATEITFADRFSVAVINAEMYLQAENKKVIAQNFYNDTYLNDQNACSSPSIVFFMGKNKDEAAKIFWESVRLLAHEKYQLTAVQAVGKLSAMYKASTVISCTPCENIDNYVTRVKVDSITENLMDFKYHSGFFLDVNISRLDEILPICTDKLQTLVYYGVTPQEIRTFLQESKPKGIDRVAPFGKSMDFSLIWDGNDMIRELSRRIVIL